jgi:phage-related protein
MAGPTGTPNTSPLATQSIQFIVEGLEKVQDAFEAVKAGLDQISDAIDSTVTAISPAFAQIASVAATAYDAVADGFAGIVSAASMAFSAVVDDLFSLSGQAAITYAALTSLGGQAFTSLKALANTAYAAILNATLSFNTSMKNSLTGTFAVTWSTISSGISAVVQVFNQVSAKIKTIVGAIPTAIAPMWADIKDALADVFTDVYPYIQDIKDAFSSMLKAITPVWQAIKTAILGILPAMGSVGSAIKQVLQGASASIVPLLGVVKGAMGEVGKSVNQAIAQAKIGTIFAGINDAIQRTNQQMLATPIAIGMAVVGFQMLRDKTEAWVRAGMAGTNYGNLLSMQFTLLSQQIAGVFVPVIQKVIEVVTQLANWFRGLSGEQQALIRNIVLAAAVMAIAHGVIGRVTGALVAMGTSIVSAIIPAFQALVTVVTTGGLTMASALSLATAGISALIGLVVAIASAVAVLGAGIVAGTSTGQSAIATLIAAFKPLWDALKDIYAKVSETIGPALDQLGGMIGEIIEILATALTGAFMEMLPTIIAVTQTLLSMAASFVTFVKGVIIGALQIVEAIGGIKTILYTILGTVVVVGTIVGVVLAAIAIKIAIAFLPITIAIAAVVAAIVVLGAAVGGLIYMFRPVLDQIAKLWNPVMDSLRAFWAVAVEVTVAVVDALVSMFGGMGEGLDSLNDKLVGFVKWIGEMIPLAANAMIQALGQIVHGMAGLGGMLDYILGTNLEERLNALARRIRAIRVEVTPGAAARDRDARQRTDVLPAGGQFEQAMDLFRRINEAAIKSAVEAENKRRQENMQTTLDLIERNTRRSPVPVTTVTPTPSPISDADIRERARILGGPAGAFHDALERI